MAATRAGRRQRLFGRRPPGRGEVDPEIGRVRRGNPSGVTVYGFATIDTTVYRVSLVTGRASTIGQTKARVTDIALPLDQWSSTGATTPSLIDTEG